VRSKKQQAPQFSDEELDRANDRIADLLNGVSDEELHRRANEQALAYLDKARKRETARLRRKRKKTA